MADKQAPAGEPLRVMARADYAVQVKEHLMAQPETYLVVQGETVLGEFDTEAAAAEYVAFFAAAPVASESPPPQAPQADPNQEPA